MERDLDIMETILDKLFQEDKPGSRFLLRRNQTRGIYLPNFGVIFSIAMPLTGREWKLSHEEEIEVINAPRAGVAGKTAAEKSRSTQTLRDKILNPIVEFLGNYADAIGQLSPRDRVMVIYAPNTAFQNFEDVFVLSGGGSRTRQSGLAAWISRKDISDYRARKISEAEFKKRLKTTELSSKTQNTPDLRIMAQVLETGLKSDEDNAFRLYGDVSHLYLKDFGALFFFEIQYANRNDFNVYLQLRNYEKSMAAYEKALKRYQESLQKVATMRSRAKSKTPQVAPLPPVQVWTKMSLKDSTSRGKIHLAFRIFENRVKDYLLDYGRTVRIVRPDQWLVVSMKVRDTSDELPERVVFQVKKSVLEAFDQRKMSREQALRKIKVTRYN